MAMPSWYDIRGLGERADEPCDGNPAELPRMPDAGCLGNFGNQINTHVKQKLGIKTRFKTCFNMVPTWFPHVYIFLKINMSTGIHMGPKKH
jgi:hypothetical protein